MTGNYRLAESDLEEVVRIAARAGMGRHLADCHIESIRLFVAQNKLGEAHDHLAKTKEMINRMGYYRRHNEVKELEGVIRSSDDLRM